MSEQKRPFSAWSFLRDVLSQGTAIQMDYAAGKYPDYEHFAMRMDAAARERAEQLENVLSAEYLRGRDDHAKAANDQLRATGFGGPPCGCGEPNAQGVQHRVGAPCIVLPTSAEASHE